MNDYIEGYTDPRNKWQSDQAERMVKQLEEGHASFENGVMRWKSNGNIPPADICEFAAHLGYPIDLEKTSKVNEEETAAFFARYREAQRNRQPSEEELFEMRAAFGEGTIVENVITGRKIKL